MDAEACLFAYPAPGSSMPRAHVAQMRRAEEHREVIGPAVDDPIPGERSQARTRGTAEFVLFSGWKDVARCLSTYLFFRWKNKLYATEECGGRGAAGHVILAAACLPREAGLKHPRNEASRSLPMEKPRA